jgi:hypothetical protein
MTRPGRVVGEENTELDHFGNCPVYGEELDA